MIQNDDGLKLDLLSPNIDVESTMPDLDFRKDFKLNADGNCYICLKGDEHLGSRHHDVDHHKKMIEWILSNPNMYVLLMGDALETATKDSIGAGIFEQDMLVQEQLEAYVELHKDLAKEGRILGIHVGNHEFRVYKHSGLNLTKLLATSLSNYSQTEIKYFDHGILHYYQVGSQGYTIYSCHGGAGASRLPGKMNAVMHLERVAEAEVYAMGHTHGLGHLSVKRYGVDKRTRKVIEREKHFINTGSYLSYWGSYAHMKGYSVLKKGSPVIELGGQEKKIRVMVP